ncbi:MAG: carboxypeptidase M32 [Enterococcus sp.]
MKEQEFLQEVKEAELLGQALGILGWDMQTGMPEAASEQRGAVSSYLNGLYFEKLVGAKMQDALTYFEEHPSELSEVGLAVYHKVKEDYELNQAVPSAKIVEFSAAKTAGHHAWQKARQTKDYADYQGALAENIRLTKELIPLWKKEEATNYDVLLNQYEPGMTVEILDQVFGRLREGILEIRTQLAKGTPPRTDFIHRVVKKAQQERFVIQVIKELGFDFSRGRLDDTIHPFATGINHHDVRLTTRWHETDFTMGIFGVMHEAGHGMYEQSVTEKYNYTPLHTGTSMGIHESQSLFNELIIGGNRAFWKKQYPFFKECTQGTFDDISFDDFYAALKFTKASLIRIEADSLTYPLHIIIRYEIEKMIFNEEVAVEDLAQIWNDKYEEYLGIRPENDLEGILQDVHWSEAMFGYFPSYALGFMYAAQLEHAIKKELDLDQVLASDDYSRIKNWLTNHIHQYGAAKKPNQLILAATGEALNPEYLISYLKDVYYPVYHVN